MFTANGYSIDNYMAIPVKINNETVEILLFINNKDIKGTRAHFTKTDEAFGVLAAHIFTLSKKFHDLIEKYHKVRNTTQYAYQSIEELFSFVYYFEYLDYIK